MTDQHPADQPPTDQYAFDNGVTRYPRIHPPEQQQPEPGLESEMDPRPDLGETTYRGTGRLSGRRALITGGDSGIGGAVAIAFAREGADVAISYLPAEQSDAERIRTLIEDAGRRAVLLPGDITDPEHCRALVAEAAEVLGGLDTVVSNAGKQVVQERIEDISDEQFEATFRTNVFAGFWIVKAALEHLGQGSAIIFTASLEVYQPSEERMDYAATKAAVNSLGKSFARSLAPRGIRVNVVAPGAVWTALQVSHGVSMEQLTHYGEETGYGRSGQPAELAPAYVFLASPESSFVSGATLNVNGAMHTP